MGCNRHGLWCSYLSTMLLSSSNQDKTTVVTAVCGRHCVCFCSSLLLPTFQYFAVSCVHDCAWAGVEEWVLSPFLLAFFLHGMVGKQKHWPSCCAGTSPYTLGSIRGLFNDWLSCFVLVLTAPPACLTPCSSVAERCLLVFPLIPQPAARLYKVPMTCYCHHDRQLGYYSSRLSSASVSTYTSHSRCWVAGWRFSLTGYSVYDQVQYDRQQGARQ